MGQVLETNIFFTITGIATIVVTILLVVALIYIIRVIKDLSHISKIARSESDEIIKDIAEFRSNVKSGTAGFKGTIIKFLKMIAPKSAADTTSHTRKSSRRFRDQI